MDVVDVTSTGDSDLDALIEGPKWNSLTLTFSFPSLGAEYTGYDSTGEPFDNFAPFNLTQQAAVESALTAISGFTNLTFAQSTGSDAATAVLRFGMSDMPDTAYTYLPSTNDLGGDAWFNNSSGDFVDPVRGNYAWIAIFHEIGHSLGLGHPHEADPPMSAEHDQMAYTVMSYRSYMGADVDAGYTNGDWGFAQSYMMEDIAALQALYGANFTYRDTDTTYTWSPTTGEEFVNGQGQGAPGDNVIFMTVWDGGGNDTFDFSNHAGGATIDLRPGSFTALAGQQPDIGGPYLPGNIATALLYQGDPRSLIENAIGTSGNDTIDGNQAVNLLHGGSGDDWINGYEGNDTIYGDGGNDDGDGGDGNDLIFGGAGGDNFGGGAGDDTIYGGTGQNELDGGDGNDKLYAGGEGDVLSGDGGDDVLHGGAGDDFMNAGSGNNTLIGGDGNDTLEAGSGDDTLDGGSGNDSLNGGGGHDILTGGTGDDYYYLYDSSEQIVEKAGEGTDTVTVDFNYVLPDNFENAVLSGSGVDSINVAGNAVDNVLFGSPGDNVIDGGAGADTMYGSAGNDTFYVDNPGDVVYEVSESGGGTDTVYSSVSYVLLSDPPVDPNYDPYAGASLRTDPTIGGVENLFLTGSADLNGTGNARDNHLVGNSGANQLEGGIGNDTLDGGTGADRLYGGVGDDTFHVDQQADLVFENAGEGTDTVDASAGYYLFDNIENLTLDSGAGDIFGVGNALANTITGNEGSNLLIGGSGNDTIHGGGGVDSLFGQDGADKLYGDAGTDYLVGGIGNDTLDGGAGPDALYGEDGNDTLTGGTTFDTDILVGGSGADVLHGDSGLGDYDLMDGGAGNDTYYVDTGDDLTFEAANGGTDTVYANVAGENNGVYLYANVEDLVLLGTTTFGVGNELANQLTGNDSVNWLLGGDGNDIIDGGKGNDVLFGQGGSDSFVFDRGTGGDVIGDFVHGEDRIDVHAFGFASFADLATHFSQAGADGAIDLGGGDFVVLQGVTMASLDAGDFVL